MELNGGLLPEYRNHHTLIARKNSLLESEFCPELTSIDDEVFGNPSSESAIHSHSFDIQNLLFNGSSNKSTYIL